MGCCFACFRDRDNRHSPTTTTTAAAATVSSSSRPTKPNDAAVASRNRLSNLFLSQEREDSACNEGKNFGTESQRHDKGLKDEAMSHKARGTVGRTPTEIWNASEELKASPSSGQDFEPSRFHSGLPNTSANNVQLGDQPFNPTTPRKCNEEWVKRTCFSEQTPSSCISNAQSTPRESLDSTDGSKTGSLNTLDRTENTSSVLPWPSATSTNKANKSVHFGCEASFSSYDFSDFGGWHMRKTVSPNNEAAYKSSPYPTSLKVPPDEKQTAGTVCSGTLDGLPNGKPQVHTLKNVSYENDAQIEESLSSWFKPASVILEERNKRMEIAYNRIRRTPSDRPIIGMVAAHWNEDEDADAPPPKWWDGNGIPNSTNKYKEDQKVSWHATPFEERLEKALSEETIISQRKDVCGKPTAFDENEESDTAVSQLQFAHPQSVVSF